MSKYKKENYIKSKINNYYKNKYKNKYKNEYIKKNMRVNQIKDERIYKINNYYKNKYEHEYIMKNMKIKRIKERKIDIIHRIYNNLISRIYITFKKNNLKFDVSYEELLGCDIIKLKDFILNSLKENMTLENYGEWEIDHIKPVSKFNFNNRNELFECFNYTNLQPLWQLENRKKFNHY